MSTRIVRTLPEKDWRQFVDEHPQGNIFHTPEMFRVFSRAHAHRRILWSAVRHRGRVSALLLPVQITLINEPLQLFTTRAVVYGGVLCAPGREGREGLATLLHAYKRQSNGRPLFTELRHMSEPDGLQPISQYHDFAYKDHLNFLIDIGLPVEQVWGNIHKSTRKNIRKALNKDELMIEQVHTSSQVATCYDIFQKTYARADVPLADHSLFEATFDILHPKGMAQFLLGRIEDTYVAAAVALVYKDTIHGWHRGFDRAYASFLPNDLMVWHVHAPTRLAISKLGYQVYQRFHGIRGSTNGS